MPAIIISASGMATGGRVLHHLKAALPDARNTFCLLAIRPRGHEGARLVDGEKVVKIHGEMIPVRAEVALVESMSAHADSNEVLRWLGGFARRRDLHLSSMASRSRWTRSARRFTIGSVGRRRYPTIARRSSWTTYNDQ
jgi:Cft2 family RNA processing exonuclease